jgi:ethanolamine phosphate transferase 2 subunit G
MLSTLFSYPNTAKDFTEVDNNVTRNVAPELENNDWGLMVLHYLGLDHIGHKSGPRR